MRTRRASSGKLRRSASAGISARSRSSESQKTPPAGNAAQASARGIANGISSAHSGTLEPIQSGVQHLAVRCVQC